MIEVARALRLAWPFPGNLQPSKAEVLHFSPWDKDLQLSQSPWEFVALLPDQLDLAIPLSLCHPQGLQVHTAHSSFARELGLRAQALTSARQRLLPTGPSSWVFFIF